LHICLLLFKGFNLGVVFNSHFCKMSYEMMVFTYSKLCRDVLCTVAIISNSACLSVLMCVYDIQYGLLQFIGHDEAMTILCRFVDPRDLASMLEAVKLLAAVCLVPPDGLDDTFCLLFPF